MLSDWHHINASNPPSLTNNAGELGIDDDCEEERDYHSLPHDQIEYGPIYGGRLVGQVGRQAGS
ncbi:hypothetical protein PPACK8108_LOCUS20962 [Phakopsora pachyrhizi]|uniref:Uncharacterized protein n=1 Tax=Phakopsora pachyrhizi TaxID=170000 RepID=A0AAV0AXM8_PHAPC|nr:hypothetical protein PPACK8108_LOCUS9738 [Phakopsora pachyrhizi]CAH7686324.1 hypothetical protein PPACK8108_LOCUS20962 [Phakopsora pachyrhizi]